MKGGYQIIDLSGVTIGTQATIAGIYDVAGGNNGKPFMVITPDGQRVFAEVKAGTNKFVTAYLGADGSSYIVEISKANKVDITLQEKGSTSHLGTMVDISTYDGTTDEKTYRAPADGYIRLYKAVSTGNTGSVTLKIYDGSGMTSILDFQGDDSGHKTIFVKKGTILCVTIAGTISATHNERFYPLV